MFPWQVVLPPPARRREAAGWRRRDANRDSRWGSILVVAQPLDRESNDWGGGKGESTVGSNSFRINIHRRNQRALPHPCHALEQWQLSCSRRVLSRGKGCKMAVPGG